MKINYKVALSSLIICFIPAIIGGLFTSSSVSTWYPTLNKPAGLTPPNWLFGPVWTILYLMQGISLYLITITKIDNPITKLMAKLFFFLQLIFNLLWSIFFFGLKSPMLAFVEIGLLDITVIFTIIAAYRIKKSAAYFLIPYLLWISFATILNYQIVLLNRG